MAEINAYIKPGIGRGFVLIHEGHRYQNPSLPDRQITGGPPAVAVVKPPSVAHCRPNLKDHQRPDRQITGYPPAVVIVGPPAMPIVVHCRPNLMDSQRPDRQITGGPPAVADVGPSAMPTVARCWADIGLLYG